MLELKPRDKIRLLTNIQRILDDDQGVVLSIKSEYGDEVWEIIQNSLIETTHKLLGEKDEQTELVVNSIHSTLNKIENSPVLSILKTLIEKIESQPKKQEAAAAQPPHVIVHPQNPPMDASELSEEEKANIISNRFPPRSRGVFIGGL